MLCAAVEKTKQMAYAYVEKAVLTRYNVPRKLVRSTINMWVTGE